MIKMMKHPKSVSFSRRVTLQPPRPGVSLRAPPEGRPDRLRALPRRPVPGPGPPFSNLALALSLIANPT